MKTKNLRIYMVLISILMITPYGYNQQLGTFTRGHTIDDVYLHCATNDSLFLFYFTQNGSVIHNQHYAPHGIGEMCAETTAGKVFAHDSQIIYVSNDYGKTFTLQAYYPSYVLHWFNLENWTGGSIPGEFYMTGNDPSVYPYKQGVIHRTIDSFQTNILIADTCDGLWNSEVGHISGELYQTPEIKGHAFLCHSLNYGATFDTIPIDTTLINENIGLKFFALSRGGQQGDLFLVSKQVISATDVHYTIYHTADYGHTWVLKSTQVFDSELQMVTGGRASCSFYIANLKTTVGSQYYTLQIYFSANCGETFTKHEFLLTPDVGIKDLAKDNPGLIIAPNPAIDNISVEFGSAIKQAYRIKITDVSGKVLFNKKYNAVPEGNIQHISLTGIPNGVYVLSVYTDEVFVASKRFVVTK